MKETLIKTTKSFQTSDGILHGDKVAALKHEQKLEFRGLLQTKMKQLGNNGNLYSALDIARVLAEETEAVISISTKYRIAINRSQANKNRVKAG
jgi:hypothetical protein